VSQDSLSSKQLEEVVITAQYEPQSAQKSVYKVRTISLEQIKEKGATRLQDVLNTELNIRFSQDLSLGGSNLSLQGLAGQNVKVLIDGVPMVGRQGTSNEININQININSIERIEIVEGPMSVVYGADALAGVINIITKKAIEGKLDLTVKAHTETAGREYGWKQGIHNESVGGGYAKKNFYTRADISRNYFGGWQGNAEGRDKQWHPKTQYFANGLIGYSKNKSNLYYRLDYLNEDIYNPGVFEGIEATDQNYFTNRFMHQVQGSHSISNKLQMNGAVAYSNYNRKTQTTTVNQTTGDVRLAIGAGLQDVTQFDGITFRATAHYKINDQLSLQPGVDFNHESGSGGRVKTGTQAIGDYAFFVSGEWKVTNALLVRPGIRMVRNTIYDAPPFTPSLNVKLKINTRQDLRISYGRGFRAPSLRELYFDFFDANHSIEGNTDLKAELSHSFNALWNWQVLAQERIKFSTAVGAFYNTIDNMIGFGQKPGNTLITTYINIDRFKTQGFTWNNTFKAKRWDLNVGFGYTGRFNQLSESVNDIADFVWSSEVTSSANYRIPKAGLVFSLYYKFTGVTPYYELVTVNGEQVAQLANIDSFQWADFTTQKELSKHLSLTAGVRNLLDITNVSNTSASATGTHSGGGGIRPIGYGRSYFISISFSLNK
jgi:outer membrane receptor for ferrienterochelin and colicins